MLKASPPVAITMPFTFSHPALIIPLRKLDKRYYSITGLVIGSIVPDCKFFTSNTLVRDHSHSWWGLLWLDVPLGVMLCFLFHNTVRDCLLQNSTPYFHSRFIPYAGLNWNNTFRKNWPAVIISLLAGALSHFLWDRLTHGSYYFLSHIPGINNVSIFIDHPKLVYRIFQGLYSAAGLAVVAYTIHRLPPNGKGSPNIISKVFWYGIVGLSVIIFALNTFYRNYDYIEEIIGSATSAFFIALFIVSILFCTMRTTKSKKG